MSSQTPNLNLVLPVGTEKVSRQIINDNNTKIDTAVGANSQAISNLQSDVATHSVSTMSEFIALFTTNDKVLRVRISGTLSSSLIDEANRNALLFAWINSGWIYYFAEDYEGVFGCGYMNASTQQATYKKLATKSDIAYVQYDIPNSTAQNVFNLPSGMTTAILVGASCFSKYQTWVDSSYANGAYFGNVGFTQGNGKFAYTPYNAGESTKVRFVFMKID